MVNRAAFRLLLVRVSLVLVVTLYLMQVLQQVRPEGVSFLLLARELKEEICCLLQELARTKLVEP